MRLARDCPFDRPRDGSDLCSEVLASESFETLLRIQLIAPVRDGAMDFVQAAAAEGHDPECGSRACDSCSIELAEYIAWAFVRRLVRTDKMLLRVRRVLQYQAQPSVTAIGEHAV